MTPEQERFRRAFFSMDRRIRRSTDRPVMVHGHETDIAGDPAKLAPLERINLRAPDGNFVFVVGYSDIDGPDVIT